MIIKQTVCDKCGQIIEETRQNKTISYQDERHMIGNMDICDNCYFEHFHNREVTKSLSTSILILKDLWRYEKSEYSDKDIRQALDLAISVLEQIERTNKCPPSSAE